MFLISMIFPCMWMVIFWLLVLGRSVRRIAVNMSSPLAPGSPGLLRRSMSGNAGLNTLGNSSSGIIRRPEQTNNTNNPAPLGNAAYRASLVSHFTEDLDRRRRVERNIEEGRSDSKIRLPVKWFPQSSDCLNLLQLCNPST